VHHHHIVNLSLWTSESVLGGTICGRWLKKPEDIKSYPLFPESNRQSALCKSLTREVWNQLHDKKDASGVSFKTCILSGCQNVDSGIGCYAGSHDSYKTFAPLFDTVIELYHKHAKHARHVSNMNANRLRCPKLPENEAALIVSTRIRVGRNLKGYPLGPGITNDQRIEIMNKMAQQFEMFTGDLAGTFYPLTGLSSSQRKQLIADHFLFKEGDRFLEACGLNRDWPNGRGIFHNAAKTFLIWVNEED